jgi:hypothetical protein
MDGVSARLCSLVEQALTVANALCLLLFWLLACAPCR